MLRFRSNNLSLLLLSLMALALVAVACGGDEATTTPPTAAPAAPAPTTAAPSPTEAPTAAPSGPQPTPTKATGAFRATPTQAGAAAPTPEPTEAPDMKAEEPPEEVATPDQTAATETVYLNGLIYAQDRDLPWAESLVTKGDRIVFVGSDEDALQYAGGDSKLVDLQGQFVMPGIIDAHTHPGLISTGADLSGLDGTVGENEEPATPDRMPSRPREATLAWLQQYADDHPFDLMISQGV